MIVIGKGQVIKGDIFIFPKNEVLTQEDFDGFMQYQQDLVRRRYARNYDMYTGKHAILNMPDEQLGANNKLAVGMPKLLVDEYAGYFGGNEPKIALEDDKNNDLLQEWLNYTDFADEHSEVVKSVAVYGRGYLLAYQNEDSKPELAHIEPDEGFMIYDDSIKCAPLAFVNYSFDDENRAQGTVYFANKTMQIVNGKLQDEQPSIFHNVPAVEFYSNEERQGIFDNAITLLDALDKALSRKANQVDYFDNAYLKVLGVQFTDENGMPCDPQINRDQRLIYAPDSDSAQGVIDFIEKPDGDNMQENLINRLIDLIYYTCMIPNLQDQAFSGNSSGVALQFKLLPMQNLASFQERKFIKALRKLFKTVFTSADGGQIVSANNQNAWQELKFSYTRNMPNNLADAVQTAVQASSLVSQETALSMIPGIDDAKAEMQRKENELKNTISTPDFLMSDENAE